ncbi:hypothetical protein [Polaromonas sp. CG9_12]|nr:hypothetical protein [Polaromonas sp. CG9_12]
MAYHCFLLPNRQPFGQVAMAPKSCLMLNATDGSTQPRSSQLSKLQRKGRFF